MARTTKRGTCELCGASANVGMNHGAKVCPQCTHVQSALNKRIESVAAAARSMGKTEELLGHLIPAGGGIAVKMTADFLQEISGIVGYDGEDPGELVAAVINATKACASCDSESVLHEIREIVDYSPDMGDSGLADAVRALADRRPAYAPDCAECDAANALIEIAYLIGKRGASSGLVVQAVRALADRRPAEIEREDDCTALREDLDRSTRVIEELRAKLQEALDANDSLVGEISRWKNVIGICESQLAKLRAELALATRTLDEWESRAVGAEQNVETPESELQERDRDEDRSFNRLGLLDIAIAALRGDAVPADQIAGLLAIARKVAA